MITKENADEWIELIQALKDGELQSSYSRSGERKYDDIDYISDSANLSWYRRKPKPQVFWVVYGSPSDGPTIHCHEDIAKQRAQHIGGKVHRIELPGDE